MSKIESKSVIAFLKKIPFFSEVSETSLAPLVQEAEKENFDRNTIIFEKGDSGEAMYVILEGKVKVHEKQYVYGYLLQGDCFGEYALIDDQERSASIRTEEETKVLKINRSNFIHLMTTDAGFAQGILAVMIKRHRELDTIQEHLAASKLKVDVSNAKMSGLINGAMDAIIMFNTDFRIVLTNPSANRLLENKDVLQRNVLFFFEETSAKLIKSIVEANVENQTRSINNYLPEIVKVIGSEDTITLNEGTISKYGTGQTTFYTLILRNIEARLQAEDQIKKLTHETQYLQQEIKALTHNYGILAEHESMIAVLNQIAQVAKTDSTILITGETGTGKELVARAIHTASDRNEKPLIRINCGAIPENLIESELFGHKKGAFTGATADRKGRFLLADKGTIFLDEIGEMPMALQPKLLRVIQEGEFDPVGSSETIKVDVRIIAATHRNLLVHVSKEKFREDLYYRLNVFPVAIPSLRNRGEDVCLLAEEMLARFALKFNKRNISLSDADKVLLRNYNWPGNVRELQNLVERAVIVSQDGQINWHTIIPLGENNHEIELKTTQSEEVLTAAQIVALEKENILRALRQTKWKISGVNGAAKLLHLPATTLASKIKALGITRPI